MCVPIAALALALFGCDSEESAIRCVDDGDCLNAFQCAPMCPPAVDWDRDFAVWIATEEALVGVSTLALFADQDMVLPEDRLTTLELPQPDAARPLLPGRPPQRPGARHRGDRDRR